MRKRFKSKKISNINRLLIFIVIFLISFNIGYKYLKNKIIKYFSEDNYLNNLINTSFNNQIKYEDLFIPNILEPTFKEEDESKEPIIYIYNTHDEEEYEHNYINSYNISPNVKLASYYLQEQLNNMGIISIVEERSVADLVRKNDWVYSKSYDVSRIYLEDIDGNKYIDAVSSWWVNTLGHSNKRINKTIYKQSKKIEHVIFGGFSHEPVIKFSKKLISMLNNKLKHVFYSDNGSTAVEVALKMAYQYQVLKGHPEKKKFIALKNSYHGDTLGAISVGGIDMYHKLYKPLLFEIRQAESPYCYRCPMNCNKETCSCECLSSVENILKEEADKIAGIIIEPLVQAAGGMIMYPPKYITKLRDICNKYNILLIDDEVAMGFYRTGKLFAYEHAGIIPDIICAAKGITAGYMPLSVTVTIAVPGVFPIK